ncbi:MAG: bacteriophage holin [Desulfobulbaceae bacterium]|nr:bacteriophage holin [Desulfobulbaceae bacterium]
MKLDVKAFALTAAILWGLGIFVFTWWVIFFEGAMEEPKMIALFYRGYSITPWGSIVGLLWGFLDGLVCGALFAWLYNRLAR